MGVTDRTITLVGFILLFLVVVMSKGSLRRQSQVSHDQECANWMSMFGERWQVISPDGARLQRKFKNYEAAREWALNKYPLDVEFGLVKV